MNEPYQATTAHQEADKWHLAEDIQPEYTRIRAAVLRINEKLRKSGIKHKLVYFDRQPHYSYRSY